MNEKQRKGGKWDENNKNFPTDTRSLVAGLNAQALSRTLKEYPQIFIRPAELSKWRATKENNGTIKGLEDAIGVVKCLCTDGTVGWFCVERITFPSVNTFPVFLGHVTEFEWTTEDGKTGKGSPPQPYSDERGGTMTSSPKPRAPKKSPIQRALDLLLRKPQA